MQMMNRIPSFSRLLPLILLCASHAHAAPTYKILHAFGSGQDGAGLWGSVILDKAGNVYGTTSGGGLYGYGTAFELTPMRNGMWSETILHNFDPNGQDGYTSDAGLAWDTTGNLYGTTCCGGAYDFGTVFELTPGVGGWTETVIYSFGTNPGDGGFPYAGVTIDTRGNLYGTTPDGDGVFELSPDQSGWTESVIDDFSLPHDGAGPYAGVILDRAGNLYGTTEGGGLYSAGTVYQLHPAANGVWQERFYSFCKDGPPCVDGAGASLGALASDGGSSVYGATDTTVFRLTRQRNGQVEFTVLYQLYALQGSTAGGGVVRDEAGNLYGTTIDGGNPQCFCGVVYKLSPGAAAEWTYTVLHTFTGYDGAEPDANLTFDGQGNLYGTTAAGGPYGGGVVFEITP
jgi:uncharacterized repeat protein (TIGR03803 family)